MKSGRQLKHNGRRPSEKKIIETLENGDFRFTEIKERTGLSKPALSQALQDLEEDGAIRRYYGENKVLIRLSDKESSPIETTLRHLDRITERKLLDLTEGRELLNEDVKDWTLRVGTLEWSPEKNELVPSEGLFDEFNEHILLRALTRFLWERSILSYAYSKMARENAEKESKRLKEGYEKLKSFFSEKQITTTWGPDMMEDMVNWLDFEDLRALHITREEGLIERIDEILLWIRPLLESREVKSIEEKPEEWKQAFDLPPVDFYFSASNLAASVCELEITHWYNALSLQARSRSQEEEKGGEKTNG